MSDELRERFALWEEIRDVIRAEIEAWGYTAQECPLESLSADLASAVMNSGAVDRLRAVRQQFGLIANAAEQIAKDAAKDPSGYSDGGEGFRWAAEHIRQAIREVS